MDMFKQASEITRGYYKDPNWSRLAWGRHYHESEQRLFDDSDPWQNGFARNRANLERFIKYSHDQGLIAELFEPDGSRNTKSGNCGPAVTNVCVPSETPPKSIPSVL